MDKVVIALAGPKGVGKTTVGDRIGVGQRSAVLRFADPIKDMTKSLLRSVGMSEMEASSSIGGTRLKEKPIEQLGGVTPRKLMVTLGTEWGRDIIHPDLWVTIMKKRIDQARVPLIVIDDLRFENELVMLRDIGAHCFQINRPGVEYDLKHPSERPLKGLVHIDNMPSRSAIAAQTIVDIIKDHQ